MRTERGQSVVSGHSVTVFPGEGWKCSCGYRGTHFGFGGDYDHLHPRVSGAEEDGK